MKSIALICVLFGAAFATQDAIHSKILAQKIKKTANTFDSLNEADRISTINEFVDMALDEARFIMIDKGYDPMKLPDFYKKISFKPILITYWGDFNLTGGWLQDASTIQRNGDVTLDYTDRVLTLNVPIKFTDFLYDYRYKIRIMSLGPKGGVEGYTENIRCSFQLGIDFNSLRLELKSFSVDDIGQMHIEFTGNILTDWLINIVWNITMTFFEGLIELVCEIIVKNVLEEVVDVANDLLAGLVPDVKSVQPSLMYQYITK